MTTDAQTEEEPMATRKPGLYIIFDGPPSHRSGRFVEVEDETGKSVGMDGREWIEEPRSYEPANSDHPDWGVSGSATWRLGPFARVEP